MFLRQLFDADTWTYTYLVADPASGKALLIDPVRDQVERDLKLITELGYTLEYALDTHVHADHVTGAGLLRERTGCKIVSGEFGPESADLRLKHGERLQLGGLELKVLATPGHTDDSVSYHLDRHLFTGDALFVRGTGRTDFQAGDAGQLYDSITNHIFSLPDSTCIWPGHDYKGQTVSTVGEEKRLNPRVAGKSREEFIHIMDALQLPEPKYIHQAVPANREVGLGEGPEDSTGRFGELDAASVGGQLDAMRVVDVREAHEFEGELGHIDGADNIPMGRFPAVAQDWDRDEPLLVVCRSGRRSRGVCEQLTSMGFKRVTNLRGGMLDYCERGRPSAAPAMSSQPAGE